MNSYFKIIATILIVGSSFHSTHAMDSEAKKIQACFTQEAKNAIQKDIDHFQEAFKKSQGGTRIAADTIVWVNYKLTAVKKECIGNPAFILECSDPEIAAYFAPKIKELNTKKCC